MGLLLFDTVVGAYVLCEILIYANQKMVQTTVKISDGIMGFTLYAFHKSRVSRERCEFNYTNSNYTQQLSFSRTRWDADLK